MAAWARRARPWIAGFLFAAVSGGVKLIHAAPLCNGLIYGKGHAFMVKAPTGWTLDNSAGVSHGLHAVFYPEGSSWSDSPAVMYVNTALRERGVSLDEFIRDEIRRFGQDFGSIHVETSPSIQTGDGKPTTVRALSDDRRGNRESVAYLEEKKVFVLFVLTSRDEAAYRDAGSAFRALVQSYTFLTDMPENAAEHFDLIRQIADDNTKTPVGAAYDRQHGEYFGRRHASTMKHCIDSLPDADMRDFHLLIRVAANGKPATILLEPETNVARCLRDSVRGDQYPKPPRPSYWVHVAMSIRE